MKTYSTAATARRALKNELAKINLTLDSVYHEIVTEGEQGGKFIVRCAIAIDGFDLVSKRELDDMEGADLDADQQALDAAFATCDQAAAEALLEEGDVEGLASDELPVPTAATAIDEEDTAALNDVAPTPKGTRYIREASDHGGVCAEVWAVADSMPGAKRKEVIEACRQRGIAFGTARTQYQKWLAAKK